MKNLLWHYSDDSDIPIAKTAEEIEQESFI